MAVQVKPIKREYEGSDAYLEEQSQIIHDLLDDDQPELEAVDPEIDSGFAADMQTRIDTARNEVTSNVIRAQLKGKTALVKIAMQNCRDKYEEVKLFVAQAFSTDKAKLQEFGRGKDYERASKSQTRMYNFMTQLSMTANRLKTDLIAKGYTQLKIDDILVKRDALHDVDTDQNDFNVQRPELTQKRVMEYNDVYGLVKKVNNAARIAFKADPARLGEYVYNPPVHHKGHIVIELDAVALSVVNIDTSSVDNFEIDVAQFYATGSDFEVYAAPANNSDPGPIFLQAPDGQTVVKTPDELIALLGLDPINHFLNAKNTGGNDGHLQVTFVKKKN